MDLRPPLPSGRQLAGRVIVALAALACAAYAAAGAVLWARGGPEALVTVGLETALGTARAGASLLDGSPPAAYPIRWGRAGRGWSGALPELGIFPVQGDFHLTDSFGDPRAGGRRSHAGVDIMAEKGTPVVAVADGVVDWLADEVGGDCCAVGVAHPGGWRTKYIHLDNDTPGSDDGQAYGIAPGIALGARVAAGDLVGWVGDSGNAEGTRPHLHFELVAPNGFPYDPHRVLIAVGSPADAERTVLAASGPGRRLGLGHAAR
jgi:murein DD-endopeptidase MepM/ murein hydrolase activator NlpD